MDKPVDDRDGHIIIDKELAPVVNSLLVVRMMERYSYRAFDPLKQVMHAMFVHGQIAQFINDQDIEFDTAKLFFETTH